MVLVLSMFDMTKNKNKETRFSTKSKDVQDFLKEYPKPPPEHTYELKMEKRLKRIVKESEEKK